MTEKLLMGNEAIAHAALEAGVAVIAGHPGTPASGIVEAAARQYRRSAAHGVHVEWSANEKVALELLFGASLAGKRGLFAGKQSGLNIASDALASLNYAGVRAGLVLVVVDDPGPISSQTEQDTRRFAAFAKVPVLDPSTPEQAFHMVKAAFDLSERFHTPVIVRPTTRIACAGVFFDVEEETTARTPIAGMSAPRSDEQAEGQSDPGATRALPSGFVSDPSKQVVLPQRAFQAHGEINERLAEMARVFSTNPSYAQFNPTVEVAPAQQRARARHSTPLPEPGIGLGIVAGGISAAYAREALRIIESHAEEAGVRMPGYRFMQVGTAYPFPEQSIAAFAQGLGDILVLEELDFVLEDELTRFAGRTHAAFSVHGKLTGEASDRGENDIDDIVARIERFLGLTGRLSLFRLRDATRNISFGEVGDAPYAVSLDDGAAADLPDRSPVMCAGCPHRGSLYAVELALGDVPAALCGDIGCQVLGSDRPLEALDTCLCAGAGITMAQGIAVADPDKKAIAYVGDSSFFASGFAGLANAAYNGHDITVVVLDNATAALAGEQPHSGTGSTLMGAYNEPIDIEAVLAACGYTHVYRANPLDRDASVTAVRAAVAHAGPSAVVFKSPCARIVPPDPPALVNRDACTGCKRCITSIGCPAISFNENANGPRSRGRGQAIVDPGACVGCNLCVQVCPFKAIIPGELVAETDGAPAWPPYAPTPAEQAGFDYAGSGSLPGMRADAQALSADALQVVSPSESGPFRAYPSFENPWERDETGEIERTEVDKAAQDASGESVEPDQQPAEKPDSQPGSEADMVADQIPDFGVAADFEEELEAEAEADEQVEGNRGGQSQLPLEGGFDD